MPPNALEGNGVAHQPLPGLGVVSPVDKGGNVIVNGGFETGSLAPWVAVGKGAGVGTVVSDKAHSGKYSAFMGTAQAPAVNGLHGIAQTVTIPTGGTLVFWYQGATDDMKQYADQEVDLKDSKGKTVLQCLKTLVNTTTWTQGSCDVSAFAGQSLSVVFGVSDNGYAHTFVDLYVDDVSLATGPPPTPSPTPSGPTPTPTATATPTATPVPTPTPTATPVYSPPPNNRVLNPSFENGLFPWYVDGTGYGHAHLTTSQSHSGTHSVIVGSNSNPAVTGLHAIRQTVTIPRNGVLSVWLNGGATDSSQYADDEIDLVNGQGQVVYQCFRGLLKTQVWVQKTCDVNRIAGQTVELVIGVNDNGYSGAYVYTYVDDVALTGGPIPSPGPSGPPPTPTPAPSPSATPGGPTPIQHVVIILQENRTFNNIFHGYPGANTASVGYSVDGRQIILHENHLMVPWDPGHAYPNWKTEYNGGLMNGFSDESWDAGPHPPKDFAYAYASQKDVQPYWDLATEGTLADAFFADHRSQSFAGHQFPIAGASGPISPALPDYFAADNPGGSGCDQLGPGLAINIVTGLEDRNYQPCFDYQTIADLLSAGGKSWRYYIDADSKSSIASGFDAIRHIRDNPKKWANVVSPAAQVVADAQNGTLANVSWVVGAYANSDHAGQTVPSTNGPSWVGDVINAIGQSPSWSNTVVFFTYDDWGGWFDAVPPPTTFNAFEPGFRLPLVVVSPYARRGAVDHTTHYMGSILHYIESTFGLPSLGTSDARSDDLTSAFNYHQKPLTYKPVKTVKPLNILLSEPHPPAPKGIDRD